MAAAGSDSDSSGIGKLCRACTDFKNWMKQQPKTNVVVTDPKPTTDIADTDSREVKQTIECPLDTNELGRYTWSFLHTMAAYYPDKPSVEQQDNMKRFMQLFSNFYPCHVCAEDMRYKMTKLPPRVSNQDEFSQWLCQLHNAINKSVGKPEFNCALVNERWRDGWKDGSCD